MTWIGRLRRRAALDRDLDRELQDHLERRTQALIAAGLTPAQARRQATIESGGAEQVKEAVRDVRGTRWAHDAAQDVRYGIRSLGKSPGLVIAALLSMGLGIGANTAIFSLVDAILLRALPVRAPHELALLDGDAFTNPIWEELRRHAPTFSAGAIAWAEERVDLSRGGETDPANGLLVSGGFFDTLGVRPAMGRLLGPDDDRRGGSADGPTAAISHAFWERRFNGDPHVIGRTLAINRVPFTIVGVVPARFLGPTVGRSFDVAVPIGTVDLLKPGQPQSHLDGRASWWLNIMFRLHPGQSIESATAALRGVQPQIREATRPTDWPQRMQAGFLRERLALTAAATGMSELRRQYRQPLLVLMGVVGLVLLVACANVANLLLARAASRRHELAARLALGASHGRLVRQLVTESLVLAAPGALLGLALAVWGSRFLVAQLATSESQIALALPLDWRLFAFLTTLSVTTAVGFGLAPARRARRLEAGEAMTQAVHGRVTRRGAVSGPLVVGQIALSLVLVVAAALLGRTFSTLATRDLGFDPSGLHTVQVTGGRLTPDSASELGGRLRDAAARVPGVREAALSAIEPMSGRGWNGPVAVPGMAGATAMAMYNAVTPGWFATYGTRLLAGREFDDRDAGGTRVAIVNEVLARRLFGTPNVIGRRLSAETGSSQSYELEIVGVAATAAYRGVRSDFPPTLYLPMSQMAGAMPPALTLGVRTAPGGAAGLQTGLTEAVRQIDPTLAVTHRTIAGRVRDQLTEIRAIALLSSFFGSLALVLAAIGLYGVTSYGVAERRREIGIRLTLGAGRGAAQRFVLRRVAALVVTGIALGVAASVGLAPVLKSMLYQLEPRDPATLTAAALILALVALLAGWVPARRAARIDPAQVLREG